MALKIILGLMLLLAGLVYAQECNPIDALYVENGTPRYVEGIAPGKCLSDSVYGPCINGTYVESPCSFGEICQEEPIASNQTDRQIVVLNGPDDVTIAKCVPAWTEPAAESPTMPKGSTVPGVLIGIWMIFIVIIVYMMTRRRT
jgi:hypothetical protein